MKKITLLLALIGLFLAGSANSADRNVPGTYATIAAAITAAADGDNIVISAGTYTESNLNPGDKSLTFTGAGKAATFIQAQADGGTSNLRVFVNTTAITANRTYTFSGLTIKNGYNTNAYNATLASSSDGAGVLIAAGTTATLTLNCTNIDFTNNINYNVPGCGAAIALTGNVTATFTGCTFTNNKISNNATPTSSTSQGFGGAVSLNLKASTSTGQAGVAGIEDVTFDGCYFNGNVGGKIGGAIAGYTNSATLNNLTLTVKNSTFNNNQCITSAASQTGRGGAIGILPQNTSGTNSVTLQNSTFYQNSTATTPTAGTTAGGGAIYYSAAGNGATNNLIINHCTIIGNTAKTGNGGGDGVCVNSSGTVYNVNLKINNSIIINNTGSTTTSDVGCNTATVKIATASASASFASNNIIGALTTSYGVTLDGATANDYNYNNKTYTYSQLAFNGSLSSDATPVFKFAKESIARNYVVTDKLASPLSIDQLGTSRVGNADAGAWEAPAVYTITANAGTGGTISSGAGDYYNGSSCTLVATPNSGYAFTNWTEGGTPVSGASASYNFTVTGNRTLIANFEATATPAISRSVSSLTGFNTVVGSGSSAGQQFTVSGTSLTNDISVSATSTDYEVSGDGSTYGTTISISKDRDGTGTVTAAPIYVRLKSGLAKGLYNGETITISSTGATGVSLTCSGAVVTTAPTTSPTTAAASNVLHTTATLSWMSGNGAKYLVLFSTNNDVATAHLPVNGTTYTVGSTTYAGYTVGYVGTATSASITGLTSGTTNYFAVFSYNDDNTSGLESYLTTSPASTSATTIVASGTSDYFRTTMSGTWSSAGIWESSANGNDGWHLADMVPSTSAQLAQISAPNTVSITSDIVRSGFSMANGATVTLNTGADFSKSIAGTGTINLNINSANVYTSAITGASIVNINLGVAGSLSGSSYTSQMKFTYPSNSQVNVTTSLGTAACAVADAAMQNVKLNLGDNVRFFRYYNQGSPATTIYVGELSGSSSATVEGGFVSGRTQIFDIGGLGTDATFAGKFKCYRTDNGDILNLIKSGSGNWTLTGNSTGFVNGSFAVNAGTLTLNGSLGGSAVPVAVASGATLTGSGTIAGATAINGTLAGSLTFSNSLTLASSATIDANATIKLVTNGSTVATLAVQDGVTIPNLTIISTSAPAVGTTIQVISATTPSSIVYTATPVVPDGYSFNTATGVLTYNGSTIGSSTNISTLPSNATITVNSGSLLTVNQTSTVNSITVQPGAQVTLNSGINLTGSVALQSSSSGTATFVDADATGKTVTATVEQYLPTGRNWYVGVPVTDAANVPYTALTAAGASSVSYWDEANGAWVNNYAGNLVRGRGYIAVSSSGSATNNISFSGTLNTGNVTLKLTRTAGKTKEGFNLVSNPYPSYLNPCALINSFPDSIESTIWYRTKSGTYSFETVNTGSGIGTNGVTGYIPPMQAFWVRVKPNLINLGQNNGATLTFTNAMRFHSGTYGAFTTTTMKAPAQTQDKVLRLTVSNGVNTDETVLYTNANASNGYDIYDSNKLSNDNAAIPEIYTLIGTNNVVINGFNQLPVDQEIALGFKTGQSGRFTIKATEFNNFTDERLFILDKQAGTETNLNNGGEYVFESDAANTDNRFSIILKTASAVTDLSEETAQNVAVYSPSRGQIQIHTNRVSAKTDKLTVYNELGQQVRSQGLAGVGSVELAGFNPGVYMVVLNLNDKVKIVRVIVK